MDLYRTQLESAGWDIRNIGSYGSRWGGHGGLTATKGKAYLVMQVGGPGGTTYINLCVWPTQPSNDDC